MPNGELQTVINFGKPANNEVRAAPYQLTLSASPYYVDFRTLVGSDLSGTPFRPSGVYVDNTQGTATCVILIQELNYRLICKKGEVINLPYPAAKYSTVAITGVGPVTIVFVDYPVEPYESSLTDTGGGGGVATWGGITGDILLQLDLQAEFGNKVDKVAGKGLSTEDYTTAEKTKLGDLPTATQLIVELNAKVDVVAGYGLSQEDFTTARRMKLDSITVGAAAWGSITGSLASQADLVTALGTKQNSLPAGTNGQVLTLVGGVPAWAASAGGAATWGSITGTLASQTDLNTALGAKQASLPAGTNGQFLSLVSGSPAWVAAPGGGGSPLLPAVTVTSYSANATLALADAGCEVQVNASTGAQITITAPRDSTTAFPIGTEIRVRAIGNGAVFIAAEFGGSTLQGVNGVLSGKLNISAKWGIVLLKKTAANTWTATGDIALGNVVSTASSLTLTTPDVGSYYRFSNTAAITVTAPTDAAAPIPVGTVFTMECSGTAPVTFAGAAGVTINRMSPFTLTSGPQFALVYLRKTSTTTWLLYGQLS